MHANAPRQENHVDVSLVSGKGSEDAVEGRAQFEPGSTDDTLAVVTITDGESEPEAHAVFEFAGCRTEIVGGRGQIRCGDIVKGKHEPAIWLHREGVASVRGALTFE